MANSIIATVAHPGRPRSVVEEALGPPQDVQGDLARYELGMCSGFRMDFDSLYIEYSAGKVVQAFHVQH